MPRLGGGWRGHSNRFYSYYRSLSLLPSALMPKVRTLVVDDSVVVRRLVSEVIDSDPDLEVAGVAANGRIALAKLTALTPDVVVLDVEMPMMDGLETLRAIRQVEPDMPVIMFSSLTQQGASVTLDALAQGASDYVTKPANLKGLAEVKSHVRSGLVAKVKALGASAAGVSAPPSDEPAAAVTKRPRPRRRPERVDIVAIGTSTGGPNALAELMPSFPADFPVPIVIVQHMPPVFTKSLAQRLTRLSAVDVHEGQEGDVLEPGAAWLAPGDYHMEVERERTAVRVRTGQGRPENNCRPAVDVLFRSVHRAYGPHALAVILTGMGKDGLRGAQGIAEAGGQVLTQDEATSVVWGMPGAVTRAELSDQVLPLGRIGSEILRRVKQHHPPEIHPRSSVFPQ